MLHHQNFLEASRPVIQIFLIGKLVLFNAIVAPFETSLPPPMQTGQSMLVASKADPADIEDMHDAGMHPGGNNDAGDFVREVVHLLVARGLEPNLSLVDHSDLLPPKGSLCICQLR